MDIQSMSLAALAAIGVVNVITMFKPIEDSRIKFAISLVVAFAVLFIPQDISNAILDKLRDAITIAFAGSGIYKISQKIGGE